MSCGIRHRYGLDLVLLWLWLWLAATALIRPLDWEAPYVAGAALKRKSPPPKKPQKPLNYTETDHGQEEQTWGSWGERGESGMDGYFMDLGDANCYIWKEWSMGS